MVFRRLIGGLFAALLPLGGLVAAASPAHGADCGTLLPLAVPACGVLWGISTPGGSSSVLAADESTVGRSFDLTYHFHTVGDTLPTPGEVSEVASGHLLHVNIESGPYSYQSIASGQEDTGLIRQAQGVASLHAPVFVTFSHEPDVVSKASRGTPAQYVAAWRHVHDLFIANGATNAVWVWVMTGWYPNFPTYGSFYPGNDDVDWIAWEAYSTTACNATRNVLRGTFAGTAAPEYQWLHDGAAAAVGIDTSKPEMIAEYGAVYDNGNPDAQGAWYGAIPQTLETQFPDIKAVAKWDNSGGNCQYQMSASPLTVAGMTSAGHDPYVNQVPGPPPPPQPPTASFTESCPGLTCSFDASGSSAPGSSITSYAWDFGDGSTATGAKPSHTFSGPGTNQVTLTVTNAAGTTASVTNTVTVALPQVAFVAAASTTGNATSETVTVPSTVSAGNGMLLLATGAAGSALTAPAGWTQVDTASTSSITSTLWERVATSTDHGSAVKVSFPSVYRGSVQLLAYSGTNLTNPVVAYSKRATSITATSYATPSTSVPATGDIAVSYWSCKSSSVSTWTPPAGQTVRSTAYGVNGGRISSLASDAGPAVAGPAGGLTASPDTSATAFAAWTIVVG
jgi:PKD repeat protein